MSKISLRGREIDYKWVILVICFLMEFICLGFCSSNGGLYFIKETEALGISRSVYSLSGSIRYVVQVLVALSFGPLTGRFGLKKLNIVGLLALISSVTLRAVETSVWHLYIASALLGVGIVFVGSTMAGTIMRRWFQQDVGRYTGIVMSANGIGGALAAQIITPIINNGSPNGYRQAYFLSAALVLAFSIVIVSFLRESPPDAGPFEAPSRKKKPRGAAWHGIEFSQVKRQPYFYLIAAMIFLTGISLQSIGGISIAHMTDRGLSPSFIAITSTVSMLTLTFTKFMVGFAYDKKGLRFTLIICHGVTMVAFALKAMLNDSPAGMVCAMIATILTSFALPLETVMIPLITNDLFGTLSYNKVLGVFMALNSLGLCLGSPLGNIYFDMYGSYVPVFWFFCILMLVVTVGSQIVITGAFKEKQKVLVKMKEEAESKAQAKVET